MRREVIHTLQDLMIWATRFNWGEYALDTETTSLRYDELEITGISLCDGNLNLYIVIRDENREAIMQWIKLVAIFMTFTS